MVLDLYSDLRLWMRTEGGTYVIVFSPRIRNRREFRLLGKFLVSLVVEKRFFALQRELGFRKSPILVWRA
jgi:hypothetical protein